MIKIKIPVTGMYENPRHFKRITTTDVLEKNGKENDIQILSAYIFQLFAKLFR